jgi:hypothetical protein
MMLRNIPVIIVGVALLAATATAQTPPPTPPSPGKPGAPHAPAAPPPPPTPPAAPAAPAAPRRGQPINVRVEVTITDQRGGAAPLKKTLSVIVADQQGGMVRSESLIPNMGAVPLHIDAAPEILPDGKIRLRFGLNYDLPMEGQPGATPERVAKTSIRENLTLILESAKPMLVTQSADPVGDRQVMVEVKATVLK